MRRRLLVAFAALIALLLVIVASGVAVSRGINGSATDAYVEDAIPLKAAVQDLVLQMVVQQSSVRGYLLTENPRTLVRFDTARDRAAARLAYIESHLEGHPILAALTARAELRIIALTAFHDGQIASATGTPMQLAAARARVGDGSLLFARFREVADAMVADTDRFVRDAQMAQDRRTDALTLALLLLCLAALTVAVALMVAVPRRIGRTLSELEDERAVNALAALRASSLQRMTAALAASLDDDAVIDVLARQVGGTPGIDQVVIARPDGAGDWIELRTLEESRDDELVRRLPRTADLPVPAVVRTEEALFFPTPEDLVAAFPDAEAYAPQGSWAILPMKAGRAPLAVLAMRFDIPRAFTPPERTFLLTLADQCAQALERARLVQRQMHIAHTLQQSLLPARLPSVPGVEIAARYLTAESEQEVGGDFYDAFEDGAGRLVVVVGDACGKGPEAAALTALARYTVRAVAMSGAGPAATMGALNDAIRGQGLGTLFMTAAHATLSVEGDRARVTVCRAGHPHPLIVRASGEVEQVGGPGRLLGVFDDPVLCDVTAELAPGDCIAVFTDGLTEARQGQAVMGDERLRRAAAGCGGRPAEECAELLLRAASDFARGPLRDDVAVVVVRFAASGPGVAGPS